MSSVLTVLLIGYINIFNNETILYERAKVLQNQALSCNNNFHPMCHSLATFLLVIAFPGAQKLICLTIGAAAGLLRFRLAIRGKQFANVSGTR